jgi:hypothetical protein
MNTSNTTPGLKRLRKAKAAPAVRRATLADQRSARQAAAAKLAAATPAPETAKAATESPGDPSRLAKATTPAKAGRTLHLLGKASPYRSGTALAKMLALVVDGMTTTELAAAFKAAGLNTSVSGFVGNAAARGVLSVG